MKYFYETEISSLANCINGRFIADVGKNKRTLVDKIGRVYDFEYHSIRPVPEGCFIVQEDSRWIETLIDKFGNVICSGCRDIDFFSEDGIAVIKKQDGSKRWITKQGQEFGEQFKDIGPFSCGYGCVKLDDGSWTYVDTNLEPIGVSFTGVYSFTFDCDYSYVVIKNKYYVIDKNFQIQSGPYDDIMWINEDNIVAVKKNKPKDDKCVYAYYKIDGTQIGEDYKMIHDFVNGVSRVDTDEGYIFIDLEGKQIGNRAFKMARNFGENMAVVGEFDENGEHIFTFLRRDGSLFSQWYPAIGDETEGLGSVMIGNKYYYIDVNEKTYGKGHKSLGLFHDGVADFYYKKGKYKYLTRDLKPFNEEFDNTRCFSEGFGVVRDNGVIDAVNKNQLRLSQISRIAQKVEENPKFVLDLPKEILSDREITFLLYEHASMVLEQALECVDFDNGQKTEFVNLRNKLGTMMKEIEKDVPVYVPKEFFGV